jgi:hypothetical protein
MIGTYSVWFQYYLTRERGKALFHGDLPGNISNHRWVQMMLRQSRGSRGGRFAASVALLCLTTEDNR